MRFGDLTGIIVLILLAGNAYARATPDDRIGASLEARFSCHEGIPRDQLRDYADQVVACYKITTGVIGDAWAHEGEGVKWVGVLDPGYEALADRIEDGCKKVFSKRAMYQGCWHRANNVLKHIYIGTTAYHLPAGKSSQLPFGGAPPPPPPPARRAPETAVAAGPRCGSKLFDYCCPDGSYNTGTCGPCQQKTKPASCSNASAGANPGAGGDAGNCVKPTMIGSSNIWEYTNTCPRPVIATMSRWCMASDAATVGQRRDITVTFSGNETIKFDRRQFNGFCEIVAGNKNQDGISSQRYK